MAAMSLLVGPTPACAATAAPRCQLKLLTPASYLPGIPLLVRLEVWQPDGHRAWDLWDAEATLSTPTPGVMLSTNTFHLYNGVGSALVTVSNGGDFELVASVGSLQTNRVILCKTNVAVMTVGGALSGTDITWSGIVQVTNDVIVPTNSTLTIQPDTWILIDGATSNPNGKDIEVRGTISALGTEDQPINFTASTNGVNWGEMRHAAARPSVYRFATFTRAGRAVGGGHTGTAPTFRSSNSIVTFEGCNFTDNTYRGSTIGKVMDASGSDLNMNNCVWARARMGPEIGSTALLLTNSYILEMLGPDDCDGIYLHSQRAGQNITIVDTVIAQGDDDGIDTLGSTVTVDHCIVRDWNNPNEDAKGISVFGGEVRVRNCLIVDNKCGVSAKDSTSIRVRIDRSTIVALVEYALGATNKSGTMFPTVDMQVTNTILRGPYSLYTGYNPADIHLYYCDIGQPWAGATNCITANPLLVDETGHDFHLLPASPCIDAGDPASPLDPDGTRADIGWAPFFQAPPRLSSPHLRPDGHFEFTLIGISNRAYAIQATGDFRDWTTLDTITNAAAEVQWSDPATNLGRRFYRAKSAP